MNRDKPVFLVSAVDLKPTELSPESLLKRITTPGSWPDAIVSPPDADFPRLHVEFHPGVGVSILCHEDESSVGFLAATREPTTAPAVPVTLGGQVIERWPSELFLTEGQALTIIGHFLGTGRQHPAFQWVRLDDFERETLPEGPDLAKFWKELNARTEQ